MVFPPDETLNVKAGNCIWNVGGIICAKLSARILQLTIHHNQNRTQILVAMDERATTLAY